MMICFSIYKSNESYGERDLTSEATFIARNRHFLLFPYRVGFGCLQAEATLPIRIVLRWKNRFRRVGFFFSIELSHSARRRKKKKINKLKKKKKKKKKTLRIITGMTRE